MLKTRVGDEIRLVQQPDHARVSGYLAAHWGGANGFARPGQYPGAADPDRWREEVVLAIAEHDNGWWEWEAMPVLDEHDGLPIGLAEVARGSPEDGFRRWRLGVPRLAERHPYAALLVSLHAYWLYAFAFEDLANEGDDAWRHPLFGGRDNAMNLVIDRATTRAFIVEQRRTRAELEARLERDPVFAQALRHEHLIPHFRLLQLLDSLSLLLAFDERGERTLLDVPRASWQDRTTMSVRRESEHRFVCDPYPFDMQPLAVPMPARVMAAEAGRPVPRPSLTRLHAAPLQTIPFELVAAR